MKKIRIILAILLIALVLGGCSQQLSQGEVIKKEFVPAHSETTIIPMATTDGKNVTTIMMPYVYYYADTYKVTIKGYIDSEKQTATYRVTKEVYDSINIGDEFVYNEEFEPDEPEYIREKQEEVEE